MSNDLFLEDDHGCGHRWLNEGASRTITSAEIPEVGVLYVCSAITKPSIKTANGYEYQYFPIDAGAYFEPNPGIENPVEVERIAIRTQYFQRAHTNSGKWVHGRLTTKFQSDISKPRVFGEQSGTKKLDKGAYTDVYSNNVYREASEYESAILLYPGFKYLENTLHYPGHMTIDNDSRQFTTAAEVVLQDGQKVSSSAIAKVGK
ncbi:hypothetical protein [Bifidobacterium dolichotidis]|nr:hypothetical protein [Bifidobacterium dolichotidis]